MTFKELKIEINAISNEYDDLPVKKISAKGVMSAVNFICYLNSVKSIVVCKNIKDAVNFGKQVKTLKE